MKKLILGSLLSVMVFGVVGCGGVKEGVKDGFNETVNKNQFDFYEESLVLGDLLKEISQTPNDDKFEATCDKYIETIDAKITELGKVQTDDSQLLIETYTLTENYLTEMKDGNNSTANMYLEKLNEKCDEIADKNK